VNRTLAVAVLLLAASSANADLLPGTFTKRAEVAIFRVETQEDYPDHVFVIDRFTSEYNAAKKEWVEIRETDFIPLSPNNPIVLRLEQGRDAVHLIAVPRSVAGQHKIALELAEAAHAGQIPGVAQRWFENRVDVPEWAAKEIIITYRVQRSANGGDLEIVLTSGNPLRPWFAAWIFLAVAVLIGGFWVVRRTLRALRPRASPPAA
jgi:hypothetical protein